jgi:hypothetical protein
MTTNMTEEQAVHLVRNALLVAGSEMGAEGDHWPVIKSTIHQLMRDQENLRIERNVEAELKQHFKDIIDDIEKSARLCPDDARQEAEKIVHDLRELYTARFAPVDPTMIVVCDADLPIHIQRAEAIISTLGGAHG